MTRLSLRKDTHPLHPISKLEQYTIRLYESRTFQVALQKVIGAEQVDPLDEYSFRLTLLLNASPPPSEVRTYEFAIVTTGTIIDMKGWQLAESPHVRIKYGGGMLIWRAV